MPELHAVEAAWVGERGWDWEGNPEHEGGALEGAVGLKLREHFQREFGLTSEVGGGHGKKSGEGIPSGIIRAGGEFGKWQMR